ncbi:putative PDZ domain protein [Campylobacter pinnipediorum subsp. pinnipediorum]|uniref:DUF7488 domain-containing protein n=1 Tax=Campylobacter pinnipediorum TaxID=1965231 RepID=UPI000994F920|nr:PDZ domain-containing protein [Campylobacter pinnipediorum]AQW85043.1 putative PDZ domain protein [Campylobacter pinnipediorum subsp. pinnipediorum]
MKKIFLLFCCVVFAFSAPRPTQDDFNACYEKNKNSIISVNGNYGVAITENLIAVAKNSQTPLNDYIKFDSYLGLYLVKSDKKLDPAVMADENDDVKFNKTTWIGNLSDNNSTVMGHVKEFGSGLGDFDTLNFDVNAVSELNTGCCKMAGISVGGNKFIPNRYLKHFAMYDDVYYGDIGVIFEQKGDKFFVKSVDPLGRGKALMKGDEILSVNSDKPKSLRLLNETVLFAPKGSLLEFKIRRDGEETKIYTPVSGDVSLKDNSIQESTKDKTTQIEKNNQNTESNLLDEILMQWGIFVDNNLVVKKVVDGSKAEEFGIKLNDKILQLNSDDVKNRKQLLEKIGKQTSFLLLFRRDDFDFFARVVR